MKFFRNVFLWCVLVIGISISLAFSTSFKRNEIIRLTEISLDSSSFEFTVPTATPTPAPSYPEWSGQDLLSEVNKRRELNGVSRLSINDDLCELVLRRMNDVISGNVETLSEFAEKDGNKDRFSSFSTIWEFRTNYSETEVDAVNSWSHGENDVVLRGGEYLWGCSAAQHGYGILFATY